MTDARRGLPAVHVLLEHERVRALLAQAPRALVTDAAREAIDRARNVPAAEQPGIDELASVTQRLVAERLEPSLRPVLNGTGVVLHTNLGRAPLARQAIEAVQLVAPAYSNLEYDLAQGVRGSRYAHCVARLIELTGAEDALVMNNGAGALVLALASFAAGREAIISRGELIEIGGGFRVPDIMAAAGVTLVEVGTTNRTMVDDYRRAIGERTGAIVKVHRSNFTMDGFVADVAAPALAALAAERGLPVIEDFGSGLLLSLEPFGLRGELVAREVVAGGSSVVIMSGDKLLGGPQSGILLGTAGAVESMCRHPLARAFRVDKLTIAALEATLGLYRDPELAVRAIPVLRMLASTAPALRARADALRAALSVHRINSDVLPSEGAVGGGAFPTAKLASWAIAPVGDATTIERALRGGAVPVIARVSEGRVLIDLRTIAPEDDDLLVRAIAAALA